MAQISTWVRRFYDQIPKNGLILDLAGGSGRHTRFLTQKGFKLLLLDNDIAKAKDLQDVENIVLMEYDLEDGSTLPFPKSSFQGVVVINYLYRPIFRSYLIYWTMEVFSFTKPLPSEMKNMDVRLIQTIC